MSEQTSSEKIDFDLMFPRLLKTIELSKIELTIANALTGLADVEYEVKIQDINFSPSSNIGEIGDQTEIKIRIGKKDPFGKIESQS